MKEINLNLYSRPGCHLCDVMLSTLGQMELQLQLSINVVNIDTDKELQKKYAARIPLLTLAETDEVLSEYFLDKNRIQSLVGKMSSI